MKKITLVLVFFLCCADLYAAEKTLTWINPDANTDGSVLDVSTLTEYELGCTTVTGAEYQSIVIFPTSLPLQTSHVVDLPPGEYWCVLRVSTINATSEWSNEVFFTLPFPVPNAPTNLAAE